MSNQRTLILLGGGTEAIPIIRRVRDLGYRAVVVDGNAQCAARAMVDDFVHASCYEGNYAVKMLKLTADAWQLRYDGVLCAAVDAPVAAAEVAAEFGLPGLSVEAARLSSDKWAQKRTLRDAHIPVPPFTQVRERITPGAEGCVVKPVDSRGGRGVVRLLPGVDAAWAYEQAKAHSPTGRVMVEQWLDGPQLSTESIIQDGRVLFTAVGLRNYARLDEFAPYVIEDGFDEPYAGLHFRIDKLIEESCRVLGWFQSGAGTVKGDLVHTLYNDELNVIELAARLSGGFFASHGHPLSYGIDFVGAAIKAALGYRLTEPKPYARGFVSQRYIMPADGDIGKTVSGFRPAFIAGEIGQVPVFSTWNIKAGDTVQPVTSHPARWGQALATGRTPDEARRRAEAAVTAMKSGVVLE